ncbi:MAG: DUF2062 domain-containing protein [Burkholderiales bacterium]|nr:DUF2062 domain-containing protein [Opitutaceae bacterium]
MTAEEHHHQRLLRFARIRRLKLLLRFMPRRARFHTYPLVGRFASFARARSYLWSFRYEQIRPSFYLGCILTLIPIPAQLPIAFFLCLGFRANFMLMGGLQFLSNPATSVPLVIGTYKLGSMVLNVTGISTSKAADVVTMDIDLSQPLPLSEAHTEAGQASLPETPAVETPPKKTWMDRIYEVFGDQLPPRGQPMTVQNWIHLLGHLFGSLLIGALLAGLALGAIFDLLWRYLVLPAAKFRALRKPVTAIVTPHDNPPPPAS